MSSPMLEIKYRASAKLDDDLVVLSEVIAVRAASCPIHQRVMRGTDVLADARSDRRLRRRGPAETAAARLGGDFRRAERKETGEFICRKRDRSESLVGLFMHAESPVQIVMVLLLLASIWTWAIIFGHWLTMRRISRENDRFERDFWKAEDIDSFYEARGRSDLPSAKNPTVAGPCPSGRSATCVNPSGLVDGGSSLARRGSALAAPHLLGGPR